MDFFTVGSWDAKNYASRASMLLYDSLFARVCGKRPSIVPPVAAPLLRRRVRTEISQIKGRNNSQFVAYMTFQIRGL